MRSAAILLSLSILFLIATITPSYAIWLDNGNPVCLAPGGQANPVLVPDGDGGALIIWRDLREGDYHYYAQRIDRDGNTLLQEDGVPIPTDGNYWNAWVVRPDGSGGAIIAYQATRFIPGQGIVASIKAARLDRNGTMLWPDSGVTLCEGDGLRWRPSIAPDGAGGAIVGWDQRDDIIEHDWNIYIQRVAADGTVLWNENGIPVCTAPLEQYYVRVGADSSGGAFVTWQDGRDGDNHVYVQHVDAGGNMLWDPDGRAITTPSENTRQAVALPDGEGGAFVSWVETTPDGRYLYMQRIDENGDPLWAEEGVPVCEAPGSRCTCWNLIDREGRYFIVWRDKRSDEWDIYAQRIDRNGTMLWQRDGVPVCTASGSQYDFVAVADGSGGVYAVWEDRRLGDNYDIYAQWIDAGGYPRWMENGVALCDNDSVQMTPAVTTDMEGGAYVAWVDYRYRTTDRQERDIFATRIIAEEAVAVPFDIKPGSCPNPLNPKSNGVLPAAILGTAEFDLSSVDPASVRLEGVAPLRWNLEDVGTPVRPKDECDCTELEGDGNIDLTLKFKTQELVDALGPLTTGGELVLTVTGALTDGTPFEGRDCVVIRGGKKYEEWLSQKRGLACESGPAAEVQVMSYELPERSLVEVSVYDVAGRLVERLEREVRDAGPHTVEWSTVGVQSGIYFVRMTAGSWNSTVKVPLVR